MTRLDYLPLMSGMAGRRKLQDDHNKPNNIDIVKCFNFN